MKRYIDVRAAAAMLGVSVGWVYKRTSTGRIPHSKDRNALRFTRTQLRVWQRQVATARVRSLGAHEAALFLGRSVWWLYRQAAAGKVPHVRVGHEVRFPRRALRRWAAEHGLPPRRPRGWTRESRAALRAARRATYSR